MVERQLASSAGSGTPGARALSKPLLFHFASIGIIALPRGNSLAAAAAASAALPVTAEGSFDNVAAERERRRAAGRAR